jgi:Xaa-Pro aminopeptidase
MRPTGPVKPGQVVTVEPFIDLPDKQMHYRVEHTILITSGAPENQSAAIPKDADEVEKLVGSARTDQS